MHCSDGDLAGFAVPWLEISNALRLAMAGPGTGTVVRILTNTPISSGIPSSEAVTDETSDDAGLCICIASQRMAW